MQNEMKSIRILTSQGKFQRSRTLTVMLTALFLPTADVLGNGVLGNGRDYTCFEENIANINTSIF